ncbi:MAG: ribonuclease III [Dehalococcoidia bacterium]|nr:ribonuclease III [Dehalococcoidia bacterium]
MNRMTPHDAPAGTGLGVDLGKLQESLGYRFQDERLLVQALLHRSYLHEVPEPPLESNERLEFLGDAWLNYVVAAELYQRCPTEPEGVMTKLRAALVQRDTLALVAGNLGLGPYLRLGRGEERSGGRRRSSNLSRAYEAIVGAILNDRGEHFAREFILATLSELFTSALVGEMGTDYKSELQEFCQARQWDATEYRLVSEQGPAHAKEFQVAFTLNGEILGQGAGMNRQQAEKVAAKEALAALKQREVL